MSELPTALITFHKNRFTCGVARFNSSLAESFAIPMIDLESWAKQYDKNGRYLISVKPSEIDQVSLMKLKEIIANLENKQWVFFHEFNQTDIEVQIAQLAERAVAVDRIIAQRAAVYCSDVKTGFAPGMDIQPSEFDFDLCLLTLGMAHKINHLGYELLDQVVSLGDARVQLRVTVAVHEGFDIGETFASVPSQIATVWKSRMHFLGFLSDAAMSEELKKCNAVVIFPQLGARESNSSIIGAMRHGAAVVTLLDQDSPSWMKHGENLYDVRQLTEFPSAHELAEVGCRGREIASSLSYENLVKEYLL